MKYLTRTLGCLLLLGGTAQAQSGDTLVSPLKPSDRPINLYLFDYPLNLKNGYYWPSLNQSIYNTAAIHETVNRAFRDVFEPLAPRWGKVYATGATLLFNVLDAYLPTGAAWQHQEAHRAVLRFEGINSYNQANEFRFFQKRIATKHVTDEDLIRFKRDAPAEFIRNRGIGHEAQLEMMQQMKKDAFYYGTSSYNDVIPYALNTFIVINYVNEFRKPDYDKAIDERNMSEPNPGQRDISGVEFTPWVYDMFRPFEPYYDSSKSYGTGVGTRGPHPYGQGVDRYVGVEDLTAEELAWLKKESRLVWLNILSPATFGFKRFRGVNPFNSRPMFWNFSVVHNLVAFGHVIDFNFFYQQDKLNLFFQWHNYKNYNSYFPGATLEIHRYPVKNMFLTGGIGMWSQPKLQLFQANSGTPGGYVKLGFASKLTNKLEWFVEGDIKSNGWLSGNVALKANQQVQVGINWLH
jgi:hypothetical protein